MKKGTAVHVIGSYQWTIDYPADSKRKPRVRVSRYDNGVELRRDQVPNYVLEEIRKTVASQAR